MRNYCKAYHLKDFRQFGGWSEKIGEDKSALSDETICYLWDDFTVVKSPIQDGEPLFDGVNAEWQDYCRTVLSFEIPEDLLFAYKQGEEQHKA